MKILQICLRVPWPPNDGGNIAMLNMTRLLEMSGASVSIFALNTQKHFVPESEWTSELKNQYNLSATAINTSVTVKGAVQNLFRPNESYNIVRFYDEAAAQHLAVLLSSQSFDVVVLESVFCAPYLDIIRRNSKAKVVLRAHNVEHVIWERMARQEKNFFRKSYFSFLARRLKIAEENYAKAMDGTLSITRTDADYFHSITKGKPVLPIPVGIDLHDHPDQRNANLPLSLFHLGAMDWQPNAEGVNWFLDSCWPSMHRQFPELKLHLAGRGFPPSLMNRSIENVIMEGTVEKAVDYMQDKQIMIVPLKAGSGLRIKILQGLALGKTIISTTIGCEGIRVTDKENILIADTAEAFLSAITFCMQHPEKALEIGQNGRALIEREYSNEQLANELKIFLEELR